MSQPEAGTTTAMAGGRSEFSDSGTATFTWTCPVCGDSATRLAAREQAEFVALNALRSHVRLTSGGGHGPQHAYPPDVDEDALRAGVELIEL